MVFGVYVVFSFQARKDCVRGKFKYETILNILNHFMLNVGVSSNHVVAK